MYGFTSSRVGAGGNPAASEYRHLGRLEGERATVQRLLTRRFGPLSEAALARLAAADAETVGLWAERLLDAPSLEDVFQAVR